jgi:hypothetical protein
VDETVPNTTAINGGSDEYPRVFTVAIGRRYGIGVIIALGDIYETTTTVSYCMPFD